MIHPGNTGGSRKGFCRNPRGIFPNKFRGGFCGGFFGWIFSSFFFLGKDGRKNPPKNPRQNSNQNLGASRPKSTLQGSGLDRWHDRPGSERTDCPDPSPHEYYTSTHAWVLGLLKFRRPWVTIRGASPRAPRGSLRGLCGDSAGLCGGPRDFPRVFGGSDPMLVTLGNYWRVSEPIRGLDVCEVRCVVGGGGDPLLPSAFAFPSRKSPCL